MNILILTFENIALALTELLNTKQTMFLYDGYSFLVCK